MKKYISLILILTFFIPAVSLAHEGHDSHSQAQLNDSIDIDVDQFGETIDGSSEAISLLERFMDIGSEVYRIAKGIINTLDGWLQSAIGISLVELIKMIFTAVVNILEVILELLRNIIPN